MWSTQKNRKHVFLAEFGNEGIWAKLGVCLRKTLTSLKHYSEAILSQDFFTRENLFFEGDGNLQGITPLRVCIR